MVCLLPRGTNRLQYNSGVRLEQRETDSVSLWVIIQTTGGGLCLPGRQTEAGLCS